MSKVCALALLAPFGETEETAPAKMEETLTAMVNADTPYRRRSLFEVARALYENFASVRKLWDFVETARLYVNRFIRKVVATVAPASCIEWNGIQPMQNGVQQVYLIRLLDADNALIWSKVGTTVRETSKRMKEHLRYYKKNGVCKLEVVRLWDCGAMDAEGLESEFRAHYIRKYPGTFRKNDRFINVEFDLDEADKIVANYLGERA